MPAANKFGPMHDDQGNCDTESHCGSAAGLIHELVKGKFAHPSLYHESNEGLQEAVMTLAEA